MVCQVALSDARIILPTVKNSGGTVGRFACYQQNVVFKISSKEGVVVVFFLFYFLHTFSCVCFTLRLYFLHFFYFISALW